MLVLCHSRAFSLSFALVLSLSFILFFALSLSLSLFLSRVSYHLINYVQSHKQQTEEPNYIM